jgi:hypothetical protein
MPAIIRPFDNIAFFGAVTFVAPQAEQKAPPCVFNAKRGYSLS